MIPYRPICLFAATLFASASPAAEAVPPSVADFKASAVPDRVLLSWIGDPATTASVTWRTDGTVGEATAQIAEATHGPEFVKSPKTIEATTQPLDSNLGKAAYHSATFEGLKPDTLYAYRVGDGKTWSEWFQFRTASDRPAPLQFVYVGDAQNDIKSLWSRVIRQAHADAPKARFLLHAGDLVNTGDADHEWGEWFHGLGWLSGTVPQIGIPGNHEYSAMSARKAEKDAEAAGKPAPKNEKKLAGHWRAQFELPKNGPMGLEESAFYVDVQGVRIVGLNSNEQQEMQTEWLDEVLADNPNRWTIVTHHHPIHSTAGDRDNATLRRMWQPVYDRHGVDLVLQGHDHSYGRTKPITLDPKDGQVSAGAEEEKNVATGVRGRTPGGTVYVVSVSGPKMYDLKAYPTGEDPFARKAANTQLYQIITVDGDELRYEARTATGEIYDAFSLKKREGAANEFVAQEPEGVEERLENPKKGE